MVGVHLQAAIQLLGGLSAPLQHSNNTPTECIHSVSKAHTTMWLGRHPVQAHIAATNPVLLPSAAALVGAVPQHNKAYLTTLPGNLTLTAHLSNDNSNATSGQTAGEKPKNSGACQLTCPTRLTAHVTSVPHT